MNKRTVEKCEHVSTNKSPKPLEKQVTKTENDGVKQPPSNNETKKAGKHKKESKKKHKHKKRSRKLSNSDPVGDILDDNVNPSDIAFPLSLSRNSTSTPGAFHQSGVGNRSDYDDDDDDLSLDSSTPNAQSTDQVEENPDEYLVTAYLVPEPEIVDAQVSKVTQASQESDDEIFSNETTSKEAGHSKRQGQKGSRFWWIVAAILVGLLVIGGGVGAAIILMGGSDSAKKGSNDEGLSGTTNGENDTNTTTPTNDTLVESAFDLGLLEGKARVSLHAVEWGSNAIGCAREEDVAVELYCNSDNALVVIVDADKSLIQCSRHGEIGNQDYVRCQILDASDSATDARILVACAGENVQDNEAMVLHAAVPLSVSTDCVDFIHEDWQTDSKEEIYGGDAMHWLSTSVFCASKENQQLELRVNEEPCGQGEQKLLPFDWVTLAKLEGLPEQGICLQQSFCEAVVSCDLDGSSCQGIDSCETVTSTVQVYNSRASTDSNCFVTESGAVTNLLSNVNHLWEIVNASFVYGDAISETFDSLIANFRAGGSVDNPDVASAFNLTLLDQRERASFHAVQWGTQVSQCRPTWDSLLLSCASADATVVVLDAEDHFVECWREDENLIWCDLLQGYGTFNLIMACGGDNDDDNAMIAHTSIDQAVGSECSGLFSEDEDASQSTELYGGDMFQWLSTGVFCEKGDGVELRQPQGLSAGCILGEDYLLPNDIPLESDDSISVCLQHSYCETELICSLADDTSCTGSNKCQLTTPSVELADFSHAGDSSCSVRDHWISDSPLLDVTVLLAEMAEETIDKRDEIAAALFNDFVPEYIP